MYEAYLRKSICVNRLRNQPEEPEKNNQSHGSDLNHNSRRKQQCR